LLTVIAFERRNADGMVLVVVPLRPTAEFGFPPIGEVWKDASAASAAALRRDVFTGRKHRGETLALHEVLAELPSRCFAGISRISVTLNGGDGFGT
jgi:maltooligosyltrehalose synthase